MPLTMGFPACRCSTYYASLPHHQLINNKIFCFAVLFNLDEALIIYLLDCRVEPKVLPIYPEKSEDCFDKPQPLLVNVDLF